MRTEFRASLPARINMLGNPGDGNEGDFATLSAAIELRAAVEVRPGPALALAFPGAPEAVLDAEPPYRLEPETKLAAAAVNRLWSDSAEFRDAIRRAAPGGFPRLAFSTDVPQTSGLGGSSLLVLLTLASLREFYGLDSRRLNDYRLAELAQQTEELDLGITCGFADRYVPLFGGLAYVDYRGKLRHRGPDEEPLATYERLDAWVPEFPVVVVFTGIRGDSGDVHRVMRGRYLDEAREPDSYLVRLMTEVGETAWRGKAAMLRGDWAEVGRLMEENHRRVDEFMRYAGFTEGAGREVNLLVEAARRAGAYGAKLTGAGGRGSIFLVTEPGREEELAAALGAAAREAGLDGARVFRARLAREGLRIR